MRPIPKHNVSPIIFTPSPSQPCNNSKALNTPPSRAFPQQQLPATLFPPIILHSPSSSQIPLLNFHQFSPKSTLTPLNCLAPADFTTPPCLPLPLHLSLNFLPPHPPPLPPSLQSGPSPSFLRPPVDGLLPSSSSSPNLAKLDPPPTYLPYSCPACRRLLRRPPVRPQLVSPALHLQRTAC